MRIPVDLANNFVLIIVTFGALILTSCGPESKNQSHTPYEEQRALPNLETSDLSSALAERGIEHECCEVLEPEYITENLFPDSGDRLIVGSERISVYPHEISVDSCEIATHISLDGTSFSVPISGNPNAFQFADDALGWPNRIYLWNNLIIIYQQGNLVG